MPDRPGKIDGDTVRADFNHLDTVIHYARAAHFLGLWESERLLIERYLPDRSARLLEAGCGAGRVAVGLWHLGYRHLTAFDFAAEMIDQARNLAAEQGIGDGLAFLQADATRLDGCHLLSDVPFDGALFLFNGLMQIPGRDRRRRALKGIRRRCRPGAPFIFTSHDRDDPAERALWAEEAARWARGEQNPRLVEFGDRYFAHDHGQTFMHLPDRAEVLADLAATGWTTVADATRNELARERRAVRDFADNCRFWIARNGEGFHGR
jgi:SAM-dependent methyltransferase